MLATSLLSRHLCHLPCIFHPAAPARSARHRTTVCHCSSNSSSSSSSSIRSTTPDLPAGMPMESSALASDRTAGTAGPAPLAPTLDPYSFSSCSSLSEMIGWFQQHGLSKRELQPGLVAPVAQKVVDLWEEASAQDQPMAVAHLAEIAPMAIAFSLHNSTGLKARAAVQCTIALGKLPAVDPTFVLSLVEPAAGVRQGLSTVPPTELVSMLEVLAGARVRPGNALLGAIMSELGAGMGQLPGPALASLLWALVVLGVKPTATWLESHEAACRATLQELGPQHLGRLAWASGRLGLSPGPAWLAGFCGASSHALAHARWDGSQLCGFMEGCAELPALGAVATQLWRQELLKVSGTLLPSLSAPHLVTVLRAVSELQLHPGPHWLCVAWERAFALLLPPGGGSGASNNAPPANSSSSRNGSSSSSSSSSSGSSIDGSNSSESRGMGGAGPGAAANAAAKGPALHAAGATFSSRDLADLLPLLLQLSRPNSLKLHASGGLEVSEDSSNDWQQDGRGDERRQSEGLASSRSGGEGDSSRSSSSSSSVGSRSSSMNVAAGMDVEGDRGAQPERLPVALVGRRSRRDDPVSHPGGNHYAASMSASKRSQPMGPPSATQHALTHQGDASREQEVARHPSAAWMAAYLSNVLHALPRMPAEALPKVLQVVAWVGASPQPGWLDAYAAALASKAAVLPSPSLTGAALLLLQLAGLQTRPLVRASSSAPPSNTQPTSTQPPAPQSHISSPEPTSSPSKVPESTADNTLPSDTVPANAADKTSTPNTEPASAERAGHHLKKATCSVLDEGPGYLSHRGTATAEGPAMSSSPAMSSVLHTLWAQVGGPNAVLLSDEHLVQSIQALASCGIPCTGPQQEKAALNALQPRLVRLPRLQLIGLGEAVLKLQMQPDGRWWSSYVRRLQQCLEERTPIPPAACSALLWTIVTAGLYVKPKLLRLLSMHIRAAVEGGAVEDVSKKGERLKRSVGQNTKSRTATRKRAAVMRSPNRSRGARSARSVKVAYH